jgi:DNA-binding MarR family transcriptional regulator
MLLEDNYVDFLIENNITQSQYLLLHLLYKQKPHLIRKYKEAFPSEDGSMIGKYMIDDLINRGFLKENSKGNIEVTDKFLIIFVNKYIATDEIFEIYPTHTNIHGTNVPLTPMDRNVFANLYDICIQSSIKEHLIIIEDIKYGISKDLIKIGIDKFIKSKYWLVLRKQRLEDLNLERIDIIKDNEF